MKLPRIRVVSDKRNLGIIVPGDYYYGSDKPRIAWLLGSIIEARGVTVALREALEHYTEGDEGHGLRVQYLKSLLHHTESMQPTCVCSL